VLIWIAENNKFCPIYLIVKGKKNGKAIPVTGSEDP
jgi:hypothetical protein